MKPIRDKILNIIGKKGLSIQMDSHEDIIISMIDDTLMVKVNILIDDNSVWLDTVYLIQQNISMDLYQVIRDSYRKPIEFNL